MTEDRETWYRVPRSFEECAAHLEAGGVVEELFRHETWCDVKRIHTWPGMLPVRLVYSTPVGMSPVIGAPGHAYGLAEQAPEGWEGAVRASMPPCPLDTWVHDAIIEARPPVPPAADHVQTCERCKTEQSDSGWADALCFDHRETEVAMSPDDPTPDDLLYEAWGLVANACGGNWGKADDASPGWKGAAERWRDRWHETLGEKPEETFTRSEVLQLLGQWGLPPWTDHDGTELGGKVDCAVLAEQIAASVDAFHASPPRTEMVPLTKVVGRTLVGETSPVRSVDAVLGNGDLAVIAVTDSPCGPLVEVLADEATR